MAAGAMTGERLRLWAQVFFLAMLPLAAVLSHRAIAPILGFLALIAATRVEVWRAGRALIAPPWGLRQPETAGVFAFLGFCLWIAISALWSPTPGAAKLSLNVLAAGLAVGAVCLELRGRPEASLRLVARVYFGAVIAGIALLCFEAASGGLIRAATPPADLSPGREMDIIRLGRGVTALAPSLFAAAALMIAKTEGPSRKPGGLSAAALAALFVVALYTALEFTVAANSAAVLAGSLAAGAAFMRPRKTLIALLALWLTALMLTPLLAAVLPLNDLASETGLTLPLSWLQRLYIWQEAASAALDCLPWGCGADYARALSAEGAMISIPGSLQPLPVMPTHPHNLFLQVWLELGLPGAALFGIVILAGARRLLSGEIPRFLAVGAAGAGAGYLVAASVETSLWQLWRLAALVFGVYGIAIAVNFRNSLKYRGG